MMQSLQLRRDYKAEFGGVVRRIDNTVLSHEGQDRRNTDGEAVSVIIGGFTKLVLD